MKYVIECDIFMQRPRPYYIWSWNYMEKSAGLKVLYLLCHALNNIGQEAFLVHNKSVTPQHNIELATLVTSPNLRTPVLTQEEYIEHRQADLRPITIYPEVVQGNPMHSDCVVRYILNKPGILSEFFQRNGDDIYIAYDEVFLNDEIRNVPILKLPSVNDHIFNTTNEVQAENREVILVYTGRFKEARNTYPEVYAIAVEITADWPASKEELAKLLNRAKVIFVFEFTAIDAEARLCGCAVIRLASPFFPDYEENMKKKEIGISYGWSEKGLSEAFRTVSLFSKGYGEAQRLFFQQLHSFVTLTQKI